VNARHSNPTAARISSYILARQPIRWDLHWKAAGRHTWRCRRYLAERTAPRGIAVRLCHTSAYFSLSLLRYPDDLRERGLTKETTEVGEVDGRATAGADFDILVA
jgi:hypothetical protein